jgi:hypothetical protein
VPRATLLFAILLGFDKDSAVAVNPGATAACTVVHALQDVFFNVDVNMKQFLNCISVDILGDVDTMSDWLHIAEQMRAGLFGTRGDYWFSTLVAPTCPSVQLPAPSFSYLPELSATLWGAPSPTVNAVSLHTTPDEDFCELWYGSLLEDLAPALMASTDSNMI